ncbi:MAG: hypothetical protein P4L03_03470, partial [Terracidiphilus sp.]|nr:hypothetical protein [Terracidiphilus sp.]
MRVTRASITRPAADGSLLALLVGSRYARPPHGAAASRSTSSRPAGPVLRYASSLPRIRSAPGSPLLPRAGARGF